MPIAPRNNPITPSVKKVPDNSPVSARSNSSAKTKLPPADQRKISPSAKPTSPRRVVQNAFIAARVASGLAYQKPISR